MYLLYIYSLLKAMKYKNNYKKKRYNRLKIVLLEKEKASKWLAEQLGVDRTTVSKWCTNDNQPTVEMLFRIAEVLGVDVGELLRTPKNSLWTTSTRFRPNDN